MSVHAQVQEEAGTSCSRALYSPSVCSRIITKSRFLCLVLNPGRLLMTTTLANRSISVLKCNKSMQRNLVNCQTGPGYNPFLYTCLICFSVYNWPYLSFILRVCRIPPFSWLGVLIMPFSPTPFFLNDFTAVSRFALMDGLVSLRKECRPHHIQ